MFSQSKYFARPQFQILLLSTFGTEIGHITSKWLNVKKSAPNRLTLMLAISKYIYIYSHALRMDKGNQVTTQ